MEKTFSDSERCDFLRIYDTDKDSLLREKLKAIQYGGTTTKTCKILKEIMFRTDVNKNVITSYSYAKIKNVKLSDHF